MTNPLFRGTLGEYGTVKLTDEEWGTLRKIRRHIFEQLHAAVPQIEQGTLGNNFLFGAVRSLYELDHLLNVDEEGATEQERANVKAYDAAIGKTRTAWQNFMGHQKP